MRRSSCRSQPPVPTRAGVTCGRCPPSRPAPPPLPPAATTRPTTTGNYEMPLPSTFVSCPSCPPIYSLLWLPRRPFFSVSGFAPRGNYWCATIWTSSWFRSWESWSRSLGGFVPWHRCSVTYFSPRTRPVSFGSGELYRHIFQHRKLDGRYSFLSFPPVASFLSLIYGIYKKLFIRLLQKSK
jgi:hypothetical protein